MNGSRYVNLTGVNGRWCEWELMCELGWFERELA